MGIASECLKKQRKIYATYLWKGIFCFIIGIWGGVGVLINGLGESAENTKGYYLSLFLSKLVEKNPFIEKIIPYCFSGFFFIVAVIGIISFFRGVTQIAPARTMLGKSIMTQKKSYETITDCILAIDNDLKAGSNSFGNVLIGGEWVIENEAMRIANIKGIFYLDSGINDYVLCLVDEKKNIWAAGLPKKKHRDSAMAYLQERVPDAVTGNKDAYVNFLHQEENNISEETFENHSYILEGNAKEIQLPKEVLFRFIKTDGIPTSNYSWEDVLDSINILAPEETILLSLLNSGRCLKDLEISEVFCSMLSNGQRNVGIQYKSGKDYFKAVKSVNESEAKEILGILFNQKKLPYFVNWNTEQV